MAVPVLRADTLERLNNAIKVANEFLEPFTDAEQNRVKNEREFLAALFDAYASLIVFLVIRRIDQKEETFPGVEMVIDAIFTQVLRFYAYKELPPPDWSDIKKLGKTFHAILNREKKFVGTQSEALLRALAVLEPKPYQFYAEIWSKVPKESDSLWKQVRGIK